MFMCRYVQNSRIDKLIISALTVKPVKYYMKKTHSMIKNDKDDMTCLIKKALTLRED